MFNKKIFLALFACFFLVIGAVDAQYGNSKKKKKKKKKPTTERNRDNDRGTLDNRSTKREESTFKDNLWYGMNIQNIGFSNRFFSLGLAPTVGYKVLGDWSVGALVKLDYVSNRLVDGFGNRIGSISAFDIGPTVFTRYKFLDQFFIQLEYERASFERSVNPPVRDDKGRFATERFGENYLYFGAAYGGGYPFGSYFSVHYNLLDDPLSSTRQPFDIRYGFTYNF